jgi:tetratricopeptide (TPR) repeat protein
MDNNSLNNVIPYPGKVVPKFGFKRVKRLDAARMEAEGQLNLFHKPPGRNSAGFGRDRTAQIVRLPRHLPAFEEALMMDERGDKKSAADLYWKAITDGDRVADAYCNLGIIEGGAGNTSKAFNCFTNSLEADPRHFEAHYNVANLYFETGDLRLAKLHYEIASEIKPDYPNLYFNLGMLHAISEDYRSAIVALSNYKELAPEMKDVHADELIDSLKQSINEPG